MHCLVIHACFCNWVPQVDTKIADADGPANHGNVMAYVGNIVIGHHMSNTPSGAHNDPVYAKAVQKCRQVTARQNTRVTGADRRVVADDIRLGPASEWHASAVTHTS